MKSGKKYDDKDYTPSELVAATCDGRDYDRGVLEATQATADKTAQVLSLLVELLVTKGLMTEDEVWQLTRHIY